MRFPGCCTLIYSLFGLSSPGHIPEEQAEEMDKLPPSLASEIRRCQNIKSRKNPDVRCPFVATQGDYCARHSKNPRRFTTDPPAATPKPITRSETIAARKIQLAWRRTLPFKKWLAQGPAVHARDLAVNQAELYSLDALETIPPIYFFSFSDVKKAIWAFDIRTLAHTMAKGFAQQNPYTRDPLTPTTLERLHARFAWLRKRKYQILHLNTDTLSPEQIWNQKVLDCFLKLEALGFYVSCDWFHKMNAHQHNYFYLKLYVLWTWRLQLSAAQKESIVPGHLLAERQLFKYAADAAQLNHSREWWARTNLGLMDAMISSSPDKEQRKLGAMYVLMALVQASRDAAEALPWVVEAIA
jgi:hypothetical protein